jgi:hypothetical protein
MGETLTNEQAFATAVYFFEAVYLRTKSDDVGGLPRYLIWCDHYGTSDPAAWADWLDSVLMARANTLP